VLFFGHRDGALRGPVPPGKRGNKETTEDRRACCPKADRSEMKARKDGANPEPSAGFNRREGYDG